MSYCVNTDVVAEFKSLDTSGLMTLVRITDLIAQSDAYIDGRISQIYQTPVTGTRSLLILKQISIGLTAERISNILRVKSASPEGSQGLHKDLIKQAKEDLAAIVKKDLNLLDAALISPNGAVSSYTSENTVTRTFQQGVRQW